MLCGRRPQLWRKRALKLASKEPVAWREPMTLHSFVIFTAPAKEEQEMIRQLFSCNAAQVLAYAGFLFFTYYLTPDIQTFGNSSCFVWWITLLAISFLYIPSINFILHVNSFLPTARNAPNRHHFSLWRKMWAHKIWRCSKVSLTTLSNNSYWSLGSELPSTTPDVAQPYTKSQECRVFLLRAIGDGYNRWPS
jgi:hypothetical protein